MDAHDISYTVKLKKLSALKFKLTYRQKEKSCHYIQSTFSVYLNAKADQQLMSWQNLLPQLLNGTGTTCPWATPWSNLSNSPKDWFHPSWRSHYQFTIIIIMTGTLYHLSRTEALIGVDSSPSSLKSYSSYLGLMLQKGWIGTNE